jgi:uncharacterized LabA/DUF88 family protein
LVRFFGKQKKPARATDAAKTATAKVEPAPSTNGDKPAEAPTPRAPRRRTTSRVASRPPRRDWAAEAAATPVETPAPEPTSLATAPSEDSDAPGQPAKRRRGTRGGRGRKKTTSAAPEPAQQAQPEVQPPPTRTRRTAAPAREDSVGSLDAFTREVSATLKGVQTAIADLQAEIAKRPPVVATAHPRVGIFVDVPNVIYAAERRNVNIDFGRVLEYFTRGRELVRASAYAPISDDPQAKLESQRFAHHFLGHPYRLITKPLKRFADGSMKANFDIELAVDILTMSDRLDVVVLLSGDGDFRRVVELIASRGVRVEVVAFSETASSELKNVADLYIDIGAHLDEFRSQK